MACNGNTSEICGGPNRLSLYDYNDAIATVNSMASSASSTAVSATPSASPTMVPAGWLALGCYNDTVGARTLGIEIYSIPGASMTVELCLAACGAASFRYAGLEYSEECYCDNKIGNYGALQTSGCTMTCNGNTAEICGGPNRLSLYFTNTSSVTTSTSPTGTGTSSVSGTSTASTTPVSSSLPTGWQYKGCWIDQAFGRILGTTAASSNSLTIESCIAECVALGYTIAGMEYYTQVSLNFSEDNFPFLLRMKLYSKALARYALSILETCKEGTDSEILITVLLWGCINQPSSSGYR